MFRKFTESKRGNIAAIFAIALVPIMAGVSALVDLVSLNNKAMQLQNTLDATALGVAAQYTSSMSSTDLHVLAEQIFEPNNEGLTDPSFAQFYHTIDRPGDFRVTASTVGDDEFITVNSGIRSYGMLHNRAWTADRESVAMIKSGMPACIVALDPTAYAAVKIQGSTEVETIGCVIAANSISPEAISRGGNAEVIAECVNTVGGTSGIESNSYASLACGSPMEGQYPTMDPLAHVVPPAYTGCQSVPAGNNKILSPGTYCNESLSGKIQLQSGNYILRGGEIKLNGNGELIGSDVTIFLMEDAEFTISANQFVQLNPPGTGPYAGIAIYQEAGNTQTLTINGTVGSEVSGFVYAPDAHIFYSGNSTTVTPNCMRLVGKTIEMTGNSTIKSNCNSELGGRSMYAGRYITIVK